MLTCFHARSTARTVSITTLDSESLKRWRAGAGAGERRWLDGTGFAASPGELAFIADADGRVARVLVGIGDDDDPLWALAGLPSALPPGRYRLTPEPQPRDADRAALGWALGSYRFGRYKSDGGDGGGKAAGLVWPRRADRAAVARAAEAVFLARDLINTPAADMGPAELTEAALAVARAHRGALKVILGGDLLRRGYPAIHAVGRASRRQPRLIDLRWGRVTAPRVSIVGKGVCFDSGGLDLKLSGSMRLMKKDMGGAANALALAQMIMDARLPVRLRLLIPAVENSVSGDAMRPLDVLATRQGLTVEVGNTDAEGRLVLCDALTEAGREDPALVVDLATLTGAARVALGPDLPAMFCNDEALAADLMRHAAAEADPMWRLPLWRPYAKRLESPVADLNNVADGPFAGAITAALFLQRFVADETPWIHLDIYAWNPTTRPGRPVGGEAMAIRALFALIAERFAPARSGTRRRGRKR